jgi:hypothetical protein
MTESSFFFLITDKKIEHVVCLLQTHHMLRNEKFEITRGLQEPCHHFRQASS